MQNTAPCCKLRLRGKSTPTQYAHLRKSGESSKKDANRCCVVPFSSYYPQLLLCLGQTKTPRAGIKEEKKEKKKKKSPSHKKPPIRLAIRGAGTSSKFQAQTEPSRAKQSYAPQPHRSALETFWRLGAIALTHVETVKKGIAWMLRRSYSC